MSNLAELYKDYMHYSEIRTGMELKIAKLTNNASRLKRPLAIGTIVRITKRTMTPRCGSDFTHNCTGCITHKKVFEFEVLRNGKYRDSINFNTCYYELSTLGGKRIIYGKHR